MTIEQVLLKLGIALALGLLVGLERERVASRVAGIRTFALVTVFGALASLTVPALGPWLVVAGLAALTAMLVIADVAKLHVDPSPGVTTELAALTMYGVGVHVVLGQAAVAAVVAGAVVLLLHFKRPLHGAIKAMDERDMTAIMQFALISLVVLPIVPDRAFGPYQVINPREVWWMVVLIVAIGLAGYIAFKLFGAKAGALLGGVLGGLVSSTATTVSYTRKTRAARGDELAALAAMVIVIASAVSLARVIVEIAVVAPRQFHAIGMPLLALLGWMVVVCAAAWWRGRSKAPVELPDTGNPAELKPALIFGALYALVILAVAFVKDRFGAAALYPVAIVSGLTDLDAITLSTANLAREGRLDTQTTWRLILSAALSNLVFKAGCAVMLGSAGLRTRVACYFGLTLAGGVAILLFWPAQV